MNKFLIVFAAFICAAYGVSVPYGGYNAPVNAGNAYQIQPELTLQILPYSPAYGAPNYGSPNYGVPNYGVPSYGSYPATIPIYTNPGISYGPAIDAEALSLAQLGLAVPVSQYGAPAYGNTPSYGIPKAAKSTSAAASASAAGPASTYGVPY